MTRKEFAIRSVAIGLAALSPLICVAVEGPMISYSAYWDTPLQPLFILTNAITSYYLFDAERWKAPAFLLLMLTAFSTSQFSTVHDILAVAFFIACLESLWNTNHFRWVLIPYAISFPILSANMLIAEMLAISTITLYHGLMLHKRYQLSKLKQINNE